MTKEDCEEKHSSTKGMLIFLCTFFFMSLAVAGAAWAMASDTSARMGRVETRLDLLEKSVIARLDTILDYLESDK